MKVGIHEAHMNYVRIVKMERLQPGSTRCDSIALHLMLTDFAHEDVY